MSMKNYDWDNAKGILYKVARLQTIMRDNLDLSVESNSMTALSDWLKKTHQIWEVKLRPTVTRSHAFWLSRALGKPLHSRNLPLRITIYLCVTVFGAFAKHSRVPSSAPNTSSRPGRPGNKSALTAPDSTVLPTLISSIQRSLPRMIAIWPSTRGIT